MRVLVDEFAEPSAVVEPEIDPVGEKVTVDESEGVEMSLGERDVRAVDDPRGVRVLFDVPDAVVDGERVTMVEPEPTAVVRDETLDEGECDGEPDSDTEPESVHVSVVDGRALRVDDGDGLGRADAETLFDAEGERVDNGEALRAADAVVCEPVRAGVPVGSVPDCVGTIVGLNETRGDADGLPLTVELADCVVMFATVAVGLSPRDAVELCAADAVWRTDALGERRPVADGLPLVVTSGVGVVDADAERGAEGVTDGDGDRVEKTPVSLLKGPVLLTRPGVLVGATLPVWRALHDLVAVAGGLSDASVGEREASDGVFDATDEALKDGDADEDFDTKGDADADAERESVTVVRGVRVAFFEATAEEDSDALADADLETDGVAESE